MDWTGYLRARPFITTAYRKVFEPVEPLHSPAVHASDAHTAPAVTDRRAREASKGNRPAFPKSRMWLSACRPFRARAVTTCPRISFSAWTFQRLVHDNAFSCRFSFWSLSAWHLRLHVHVLALPGIQRLAAHAYALTDLAHWHRLRLIYQCDLLFVRKPALAHLVRKRCGGSDYYYWIRFRGSPHPRFRCWAKSCYHVLRSVSTSQCQNRIADWRHVWSDRAQQHS